MPSTYYSLHAHIIFSTKNRHPYFDSECIEKVHGYLGGTVRGLGAEPLIIGGVEDHVHLLVGQKTNQCVADLVRELKKSSTQWMRQKHSDFSWQEGYGVFSVSPERIENVRKYIAKQPEHHRKKTFREEYIELLRFAMIDFDESLLD
jgi:REP element-mobilizing transposase RayT